MIEIFLNKSKTLEQIIDDLGTLQLTDTNTDVKEML
jgi:hypothetical protein